MRHIGMSWPSHFKIRLTAGTGRVPKRMAKLGPPLGKISMICVSKRSGSIRTRDAWWLSLHLVDAG